MFNLSRLTSTPPLVVGMLFALAARAGEAPAPNGARQPDDPEDGQWLRPAKNFASTRYSQLDQIKKDNVQQLAVAWTFSTGINRGHEAAPIVAGSVMYVVTPFPNVLYALDLANRGAVNGNTSRSPSRPRRASPAVMS